MRTNSRGLFATTAAVSATALLASLANAQPTSIPLGTLTVPGTSQTFDLTSGLIQWYSFTLSAPTSVSTFLDLRTSGPVDVDTEIGLYNATGALITNDDSDGPSSFSALSYGATCPVRTNTSGTLASGPDFNGRDGLVLPAGTYYLAVAGFNATFNATAFDVITSSNRSGSVTVSLNLGPAALTSPSMSATAAFPASLPAGDVTRLTATLTSTCPATTGFTSIAADLSALGGPVTTPLFNDGTNGDLVAGDNIFSRFITVPATAPGVYNIPVSSVNTAGTGSANISLTVAPAPTVLIPGLDIYSEVEPNDSKLAANRILDMRNSQVINGFTIGTASTPSQFSADFYRITTRAAAPGIYRHRLTLTTTGTPGHTGSLRGRTQTAGVPNFNSDVDVQASVSTSTPARFNQWYGFGASETVYYRVTGSMNTSTDYNATLSTTPVAPVVLPAAILTGSITIARTTDNAEDMDMWVYDSNFNAIPGFGNDGQNVLTRTYAPGTYYAAISNFNSANNLGSPGDDTFRFASVLDFANSFANSSSATLSNISMNFTGTAGGTQIVTLAKSGAFDVAFVQFTVASIPTSPTGNGTAAPLASSGAAPRSSP